MTLKELLNWANKELEDIDFAESDALYLIEEFVDSRRNAIYLHGEDEVREDKIEIFKKAVEKRKEHYPLQYILGYWYFRDMKLKVKDGVLCPREDTEVLVNESVKRIKTLFANQTEVKGIDLCSGTGCVPLAIVSDSVKTKMDAVELYDVPFECLNENISLYGENKVTAVRGDVFSDDLIESYSEVDFLTANPPYIAEEEMKTLQAEVQLEPREALTDEGDGLKFYRRIISDWKKIIKKGGFIALEIGETQAEDVCKMLLENGFADVKVAKDLGELDRAVTAVKIN